MKSELYHFSYPVFAVYFITKLFLGAVEDLNT